MQLSWVREQWKPILKAVPRVLSLVNGWTLFQFLMEEDRAIVENRYWIIGEGSLVLKRWHLGFEPWSERMLQRHLWVILPDFPIQCWNLKGFMAIPKSIGTFMLIEDEQLLGFERSALRVLVDMDLSD